MGVEREVLIKLGVQTDARGGQAFQDLSNKAKQLEEQANRTGRAIRDVHNTDGDGGHHGGGHHGGGHHGGHHSRGHHSKDDGLGHLPKWVTKAAAALGVFYGSIELARRAAEGLAKGLDAAGNKELTRNQKNESMGLAFADAVGIGGAVRAGEQLRRVVSGEADEERRIHREGGRNDFLSQQKNSASMERANALRELEEDQAKAGASADIRQRVENDPQLRRELGNENTGTMAARKLEAEREVGSASRLLGVRNQDVTGAKADLAKADKEVASRAMYLHKNQEQAGNHTAELKQLEFRMNYERAISDQVAARERLSAAEVAAQAAKNGLLQAEGGLQRMSVHEQENKLRLLMEEKQSRKQQAGAFGDLHPMEREIALHAARHLSATGDTQQLTDYEKDLLGRAGGGQLLDKAHQDAAERDPRFKEFRELTNVDEDARARREVVGLTGNEGREQIQAQIQATQMAINVSIAVNPDALAQKIKDAAEEKWASVNVEIDRKVEAAMALRDSQQRTAGLQRQP